MQLNICAKCYTPVTHQPASTVIFAKIKHLSIYQWSRQRYGRITKKNDLRTFCGSSMCDSESQITTRDITSGNTTPQTGNLPANHNCLQLKGKMKRSGLIDSPSDHSTRFSHHSQTNLSRQQLDFCGKHSAKVQSLHDNFFLPLSVIHVGERA